MMTFAAYVFAPGCTQDFDQFAPCSFGQKFCGSECVSVADSAFGCGSDACDPCGLQNAVNGCDTGQCVIVECDGAFENCDGNAQNGCEVDLDNDPQQCGACGTDCVVPHATAACENGACAVGSCNDPWEDCDGDAQNGCEENLDTDPSHCGDCLTMCDPFESCVAGKCSLVCDPGLGDCDGNPDNGCESPFGTTTNCGFCGDACNLANATAACNGEVCQIDTCNGGFDDCDGNDANGCEADLQNSAMTCGGCGMPCPNGPGGTTVCSGGSCAINCNAGLGNCDNDVATGCETDIQQDVSHCGACGDVCTIANGMGDCNGGNCQVMTCNGAFEDCNGNPNDGCEVNTATSTNNCGMCGMACSFANASATCNGGACSLGMCNAGFGNCDGNNANGCETNTNTSLTHCGMCNNACTGGPGGTAVCAAGACGLTCAAGLGDCDGNNTNGCEVTLATNVNHCGACGRACANTNVASKSCAAGVCNSTCNLGFGNCNLPGNGADNGCETNVTANDNNCGGCGNSCSMQGGLANDLECDGGAAGQQTCGCSGTDECSGTGINGANVASVMCQNAAGQGLCACGGTTCVAGETCIAAAAAGSSQCACGGGAACSLGQTCCQTPAGCKDLQTDSASCGACGHACPPGFVCTAGACGCDGDVDCNAGSAGTCNAAAGLCTCGANVCTAGKRCLPGGICG